MKKVIQILVYCFSIIIVKSQDVHFSHIHSSPLFLNPAMTGVFRGDIRFISNYKNQWLKSTANFNTVSASVDARLFTMFKKSAINGGIIAFTDAAGDLNYRQTNIQIPISSYINFSNIPNQSHILSVGIQNGFFQQTADLTKVKSFDQEPLISSLFSINKIVYDLSIGLAWSSVLKNNNAFYFGYGLFHINSPKVNTSAENSIDIMYKKWVLHGGGEIHLKNKKLAFLPSFISMNQGPHREVNTGSFFKIIMEKGSQVEGYRNDAIYIGFWTRWYHSIKFNSGFDALISTFRYDYKKMALAVSYDFTLSSLRVSNNGRGGIELSIIYITEINKKEKRPNELIYCPTF